jgi:hypothetical protein
MATTCLNNNVSRNLTRAAEVISAALLALLTAAPLGAQGFSVLVVDESGKPVSGATAGYDRLPKMAPANVRGVTRMVRAPGEPIFTGTVNSKADGILTANGMPAGDYVLCVHAPTDYQADPCEWNLSRVRFTVGQTGTTALKPITIWAGVKIHLSIADPRGLLPAGSELAPTAVVGITSSKGVFRPAAVASRSAGTIDAVVTIPHDQIVTLWAFSRTVKFSDSTGRVVTPMQSTAITPPVGVVDHYIPLTVTQ